MGLAETIRKYRNYFLAFLAFGLAVILSVSALRFQGLSLGAIGPNNLSINFILSGSLSVIAGWLIVHESAKQGEGISRVSGTYMAIGTVAVVALMGFTSGLTGYQGYEGLLGLLAPIAGYLIEEVKDLSKEMYASYTQTPASMDDYKDVSEMIDTSGPDEGNIDIIDSSTKKKGVNKTEKELHKLAEDAEEVRELVKSAATGQSSKPFKQMESKIENEMKVVERLVEDNKEAFETIQKELIEAEQNPKFSKKLEGDEQSRHQEIIKDLKKTEQAIVNAHEEIKAVLEGNKISSDRFEKLNNSRKLLEKMHELLEDLEQWEEQVLESEEAETKQIEEFEQLWERNEEIIEGLDKIAEGDMSQSKVKDLIDTTARRQDRNPEEMAEKIDKLRKLAKELDKEATYPEAIKKIRERTKAAEKVYQAYDG